MKTRLSIVIAASNDEDIIEDALKSIYGLGEIVVVISKLSKDTTQSISKIYTSNIYFTENHLGRQRQLGIARSSGDWILILDTDERLSSELRNEIKSVLTKSLYNGYYLSYENHFLNHPLRWSNQHYSKKRLFKKNEGKIENLKVHPEIIISEPIGILQGKILHYSFRSISQTLRKFTYYAKMEAPELYKKGERTNLKKLTMYPAHMFWTIFVVDEGWKDSIWGLGLALCFTYYEFARYVFLLRQMIREARITTTNIPSR